MAAVITVADTCLDDTVYDNDTHSHTRTHAHAHSHADAHARAHAHALVRTVQSFFSS